jgi:hypothetical protein
MTIDELNTIAKALRIGVDEFIDFLALVLFTCLTLSKQARRNTWSSHRISERINRRCSRRHRSFCHWL